jgi:2-keto-4-pentenoate hydratase
VLSETVVALGDVEPVDVEMTMSVDADLASIGTGKACLGDPLLALLWLARTARDLGDPLRAGEVVLSGALGPMATVAAGNRVQARISGLGEVSVSFADVVAGERT